MDPTGLQPNSDLGQISVALAQPVRSLNRAFLLIPAAGLIGTMLAIAVYRPLDQSTFLWLSLILFLVNIFLIAHIQQKTRRGEDVNSFFPMIYWIAFAPVVLSLALWLNGGLDNSAPETHRELITRKYVTHGRHGTSYYIEFTSWRANRTTENVSVRYQQYRQFQMDDPILIDVHRGALAIAWIGAVRKPD
jgi:uncharacterized membrane protein